MFVDTAKVHLEAGKGGDGAVSFRHEIYIPKGGPDGGNGGKGGDIIFRADKDTDTLIDFRFNPILKAENGKNGSGQRSAGRSGKDLIIDVPIGTVVYRQDEISLEPSRGSGDAEEDVAMHPRRILLADFTHDGQTIVIAHGGDGGFGNAHFKSSTRQTPKIAEVGEPGEIFDAELELKLLADVGLVGLPSAGKSTFLASVTNAKPEIADYPFTTLTPNLGIATVDNHDLLIADIPGLIEGASEGKGLGHAFLRHIDRTAVLLHLVDVYNDDAGEAYLIIRRELEKYSDLKNRPEIVALTKCEGLDPEIIDLQRQSILAKNPSAKIFAISSLAHLGTTELLRTLYKAVEREAVIEPPKTTGGDVAQSSSGGALRRSRPFAPWDAGAKRRYSGATPATAGGRDRGDTEEGLRNIPTISLNPNAYADTWSVEKGTDGIFHVHGEKIEKFARRTDLSNYASVNRLRDIMKKLGIRAELTTQGAAPDSIIEIAGKEFPLVEE